MVIGYLTSLYARAADTFIRNEVLELRRRGHVVHTFSIRGPAREEGVSDAVRGEQATTDYILQQRASRLVGRFVSELVLHPGPVLAAARLAWQTCPPGLRAVIWHLAYLVEAAYLAGRIRAKGIEHLHDHIGTNSATVAMLAARIAGIPWSMTVHGPVEFDAPERWALGRKIELAAFTACVSSFGRSQCMIWAPTQAWPRIHVVRCGLDETFLGAVAAPIPAEPRFVSIGRLCEQKGQLLLLDAVARLAEEGVRCELDLIGDGPLRGILEDRIDALGLKASVRLLGWKDASEVRTALLRSRALILPSFAEGLPIVIMEALALGRPVIATWIAGIPELVLDRVNGWLVPAGAEGPLVAAMRQVVQAAGSSLEQMGRAGAERVRARHDLRVQGAQLERLMLAAQGREP